MNGSRPTAGNPELTGDVALDFLPATTRIILSRVVMRLASLRSNRLPCTSTTSSRWTHCSGLLPSRWRNTCVRRLPLTSSCHGLIQMWYIYGTDDELNLGGLAAFKELAIQDKFDSGVKTSPIQVLTLDPSELGHPLPMAL